MRRTVHTKDALVTGKRLVSELLYLGLETLEAAARSAASADGRAGPAGTETPRTANDVTRAWLTAVLQPRFPGARVASLSRIGGDAGTTERARLAVSYEATGSGGTPPALVFLKLAPRDSKTRLFVNLMSLGRSEVRFYREIAPHLHIEAPRVFHASCTGRAQRFVLVMEDLAARGARFTDVSHRVTLEEARMVVLALARLHSRYWDSPQLGTDLAWMRGGNRNRNYPVERLICAAAVPVALRKYRDLVPLEVHEYAARIIGARDRLEAAWAAGPSTVIHGDAHVGNMYFCNGGVGLLDWQVVQRGQGMRDVGYFLVNSLATELRRAHEHDLIRSYLATLTELGARAPAFQAAWLQYRLHALYAWIAAAVTAAAATFQSEPIVRAGLARSSAAVVDLKSLDALG